MGLYGLSGLVLAEGPREPLGTDLQYKKAWGNVEVDSKLGCKCPMLECSQLIRAEGAYSGHDYRRCMLNAVFVGVWA